MHKKKCSTPLAIKKTQIVTPLYQSKSVTQTTINTGKGVGKKGHFYTVGGNVISVTATESSMEVPQETKNTTTTRSSDTTPGHSCAP
jgi:hypothetical protein